MLDSLETLLALARHGTMSRAALELRVTQSAVSKRLAALEAGAGTALLERDGRRVRLTAAGHELVRRTEPLLAQLRDALAAREEEPAGALVVGVSESVLASWGATSIRAAAQKLPGVRVVLRAHRSPVAIDHVRSGEYALALVAGPGERLPDLIVEPFLVEEMVVVPPRGRPKDLPRTGPLDVLSIEHGSATGRILARELAALRAAGGPDVRVTATVQSFAALVQMARAGFGPALVPIGIARSMGLRDAALLRFGEPGVARPVSLVGRKTTMTRPAAASFRRELAEALPEESGFVRSQPAAARARSV